jgi:hypothetical protein
LSFWLPATVRRHQRTYVAVQLNGPFMLLIVKQCSPSPTVRALEIPRRGDYLPATGSQWVESRRERLARLIADARHGAAELAFAAGRYADASRLVEAILECDPFREGAIGWRCGSPRRSAMKTG